MLPAANSTRLVQKNFVHCDSLCFYISMLQLLFAIIEKAVLTDYW